MKKTYLVVSDTHRDTSPLLYLSGHIRPLDGILHLGDHVSDMDDVRAVYPEILVTCVRGNNDWDSVPTTSVVRLGGRRVMLTHGHRYRVKLTLELLKNEARLLEAEAVLFGHTHVPHLEREGALWVMNPGSLRGADPCFGLMEIDEHGISMRLCRYQDFLHQK